MFDPDLYRFLPELPASSDQATLRLSLMLYQLSRRFDECCREQILPAHRARRKDRLRRRLARPYGPQSKLPEEFYGRFSPQGRSR